MRSMQHQVKVDRWLGRTAQQLSGLMGQHALILQMAWRDSGHRPDAAFATKTVTTN